MNENKKRVDFVKIKMCKEKSVLYSPRKLSSPSDAVELVRNVLDDTDREQFIVIALNTKNEPMAVNVVSIGSINATIVHPREVFKLGVISNSASLIIAHNHPSGNIEPSLEDISITMRLIEAGKILGIPILDHLIVTDNSYMSFKERNLIDGN